MPKRMKAFLPRWILWISLPMLAVMWGIITYVTFGTAEGRQDLGVLGWLGVTLFLLLLGVMLWLMGSGRLPAYIIEIEDTDDSPGT